MDEGLVRNIGVSNFSSRQIQRILQEGRIKPSCCQVRDVSYTNGSALKLSRFMRFWYILVTRLRRACPYTQSHQRLCYWHTQLIYNKTCVKRPLKNRQNKDLNEGQKYCRMLPLEHSAILLTFIKG